MSLMVLVALLLAADEPVLRVPWIPEPKLVRRVDPEFPFAPMTAALKARSGSRW